MNGAAKRNDARLVDNRANGNGNRQGALLGTGNFFGEVKPPTTIVKRDGRVVPFDIERIQRALTRCFASFGRTPNLAMADLATQVVNIVAAKYEQPTVENVQDIVEMVLQAAGEFEAAKRYILYRAEHAKLREQRPIPDQVRRAFAESDRYFRTALQKFQFYDKYSRFDYELGRRETWLETVDRSVDFLHELAQGRLPAETFERIRRAMLEMRAMPSMRLLAMAGPAARRSHITIYNCSYLPVESIDSFVEALIISMSGCGVGYSVERKYVENFPRVKRQMGKAPTTFVVEDSADGWAEALRFGLQTWFEGGDVKFDLGLLRPAGAPLKTKGGRASGPEPLRKMFEFIRQRILARQGSFLRPLDAHDIMCAVGSAAVSGGVRRTALISLFDYDDLEMRHSKDGDFERENSQRWNANNSAVLPRGGLTQVEFAQFFLDMVKGGRGEPGIFNRESAIMMKPARRKVADFGTNPCLTGDTWVAVADGRGRVQIQTLAADGKDVDVFTVKDGKLVIRTMRKPRKTGTNVPILRIAFADGSTIRVTPNHKFVMSDGALRQAIDLKPGDAKSLTACNMGYDEQDRTTAADYDTPKTYRMLLFGKEERAEHRVVSVEPDGFEDVYNGTVDDTHTYFTIGCERVQNGRTEMSYVLSKNCGEIELLPHEFCNLSIAVARREDTYDSLKDKVELATLIGTIQSLATHFPGLRPIWKENCEEERLLGVDITGQLDSPVAQDAAVQRQLREFAVETNRVAAQQLGINQSAAVTCVKPSGNSSQLLNCSSGIHARWAPYYIRNVRVATHSPIFKVLRDAGAPMDPENGQRREDANTWVVHFPVKSPEGAITRKARTALAQCEYWLQNKLHWTQHNPSCTITYHPDEVLDLLKWVWEHRDYLGGITFLPAFDAQYDQMPYVEITEEEYKRLVAQFPDVDFSKLYRHEEQDLTNAAQELACVAGVCEVEFVDENGMLRNGD